jgi:hypothetical protein
MLIFNSCASFFDVSPLLTGQESDRSDNHSATSRPKTPLKYRIFCGTIMVSQT